MTAHVLSGVGRDDLVGDGAPPPGKHGPCPSAWDSPSHLRSTTVRCTSIRSGNGLRADSPGGRTPGRGRGNRSCRGRPSRARCERWGCRGPSRAPASRAKGPSSARRLHDLGPPPAARARAPQAHRRGAVRTGASEHLRSGVSARSARAGRTA